MHSMQTSIEYANLIVTIEKESHYKNRLTFKMVVEFEFAGAAPVKSAAWICVESITTGTAVPSRNPCLLMTARTYSTLGNTRLRSGVMTRYSQPLILSKEGVLLLRHIGFTTWNSTMKTTAAMMTAARAALDSTERRLHPRRMVDRASAETTAHRH
ncbi:hypothetical protein DBV15_08625 [Temnothorax longispinosus]|uniref:Uncharacterized protein n=1 Tax=Temnothorax longispinosus TaxID=300112 RepID=A0A4S2KN51_9HYME|nr:hypothetical protein DBV15_08625 [Temnothorax longispinosus]